MTKGVKRFSETLKEYSSTGMLIPGVPVEVTHFSDSVFFRTIFVHDGLLLFSDSFLEINAAALTLLLSLLPSDTCPDPPPNPDALGLSSTDFKLTSFLPTFTVTVTV